MFDKFLLKKQLFIIYFCKNNILTSTRLVLFFIRILVKILFILLYVLTLCIILLFDKNNTKVFLTQHMEKY